MKEKKLYTCEICHTDYAERFACKQCEQNHKTKLTIKSMRFKPKQGDVFWSFYRSISSDKWLVISITWTNTVTDIARFKVGWCYRTEAEAKSALPEIAKEQGVGYEL